MKRLDRFLAEAHVSTLSIILAGLILFTAVCAGDVSGFFVHRRGVGTASSAVVAWAPYNPLAELRARAETDGSRGMDRRGVAYLLGDGVGRDFAQALHWLKLEAALGDPLAHRGLGLMAQFGLGTPADDREARRQFAACAAADPGCGTALARLYYDGRGGDRDYAEARRVLSSAAAGGDRKAESLLGFMCANGEGGPVDPAEGFRWTRAAALQGLPDAMDNLGQYYAAGLGVRRNRTLGHAWLLTAAEAGESSAMYRLASLKRRNPTKAVEIEAYRWFTLALRRFPDIPASREEAERALAQASARLSDQERAKVDAEIAVWRPKPPVSLPEAGG